MNPFSSRSLALSLEVNWPPRIWFQTDRSVKSGSSRCVPTLADPDHRLGGAGAIEQDQPAPPAAAFGRHRRGRPIAA